ncbi:MAG TPA: lipid II flippase MurJ, partial [Candidatus Paceibacterota bacterium]|nr:lipid II flippase MurJ [Candidatus Paceibacterota bacterium]
ILYNTGIIIGALYFVPYFRISGRPEILGLGAGVVLGALMHLLLQAGAALKAGFRFRLIWDMADDGFNKIIRLMIPRTLGLGAYSIESAVTNAIASTLGAGSITVFNFANNIQFVPIAVLGVSVATAVFPRLSSHASSQEFEAFWSRLKEALGRTLMIVGSVAVLVFLFRELIIKIIFQTGAFRGGDVHATAQILGIFMFGVVAQSLIPIMSRAFYALQNTRTPVMISVLAIAVNISLALLFTFRFHFGIQGLAWAFAISGNLNFLLLYLLFRRRYSY